MAEVEPTTVSNVMRAGRPNSVLTRRGRSGGSGRGSDLARRKSSPNKAGTPKTPKTQEPPAATTGEPPRTRSMLARLGIAPISLVESKAMYRAEDLPPRSPTGAMRTNSIVVRKDSKVAPPTEVVEGREEEVRWHDMPEPILYEKLATNPTNGLTQMQRDVKEKRYGKNLITPPKQLHPLLKLLLNFVGGFQCMLLVGAVLSFIIVGLNGGPSADVQDTTLAISLVLVVLLTGTFQWYQEGKADDVMAQLRALTADKVFVIREGITTEVLAESLVPGDIVNVKAGDKVPADIRIIFASDLKVNNASLTGENVDIKLGRDPQAETLYESKNIARSGCNITCGSGLGVVFAIGDETFFGKIAAATTQAERPDTLLKQEIKRLVLVLGISATILGLIFFLLAMLNGYGWKNGVMFLISIITANVPEGLLPEMTIAMSQCARRMRHAGVLVNNLEIIETLGAVTVICSDKTGTLTCNRMTVSHVVYDKVIHVTKQSPIMPGDNFELFDPSGDSFEWLQRILTLNTDAMFLANADGVIEGDVMSRNVKGDASEAALIKFIDPVRSISDYRAQCRRLAAIPFNSTNKWMLSICEQERSSDPDSKPLHLLMKGAPERVLDRCAFLRVRGEILRMTQEQRDELENINKTLAKRGERVLAFAYTELDRNMIPPGYEFEIDPPNFPVSGLTYVGFVSMIDPPRPSVKPAVAEASEAGIKVFMVTGDHPITARSIAKSLNLITAPTLEELQEEGLDTQVDAANYREAIVVHGQELAEFAQADWDFVLQHKQIVFARTMPQQKQEIVRQLASLGHIVGMTGDGVNDAPALKAAHVGIAMGSGTSVAKEAAQVTLHSDDFGAIVDGIREGRLLFDNLKKCCAYVLSANVPQLLQFLVFVILQCPLGIETILIIVICVGTDMLPAVSIAFEGPETSIMRRKPRRADEHLVGCRLFVASYFIIGIIQTFGCYFGWCTVFIQNGFDLPNLINSGNNWRDDWSSLDSDRQDYFNKLCRKNHYFLNGAGGHFLIDCQQGFVNYRVEVLRQAQASFFAGAVWAQVGNVLVRKTQVASIIDRLFNNRVLLVSIATELVLLFSLIYIPGLNHAFYLGPLSAKHLFCNIWIAGFEVLFEEGRKWLCRRNLKGFFAQYSTF